MASSFNSISFNSWFVTLIIIPLLNDVSAKFQDIAKESTEYIELQEDLLAMKEDPAALEEIQWQLGEEFNPCTYPDPDTPLEFTTIDWIIRSPLKQSRVIKHEYHTRDVLLELPGGFVKVSLPMIRCPCIIYPTLSKSTKPNLVRNDRDRIMRDTMDPALVYHMALYEGGTDEEADHICAQDEDRDPRKYFYIAKGFLYDNSFLLFIRRPDEALFKLEGHFVHEVDD